MNDKVAKGYPGASAWPAAALLSLLLVLPFAILEYVFQIHNRRRALDAGQLADLSLLFGLLWLLPTLFLATLLPLLRTVSLGNAMAVGPGRLVLRVVLLLLLAWAWGSLVADQLPCFLGVPNCD